MKGPRHGRGLEIVSESSAADRLVTDDDRFARKAVPSRDLLFKANQQYLNLVLSRSEGRFAIVTNAGWDAVDADVTTDERG